MVDPFIATGLLMIGMAAITLPPVLWLFPKIDRALGRLSDYLDARRAR